jgi:hypothetical protein
METYLFSSHAVNASLHEATQESHFKLFAGQSINISKEHYRKVRSYKIYKPFAVLTASATRLSSNKNLHSPHANQGESIPDDLCSRTQHSDIYYVRFYILQPKRISAFPTSLAEPSDPPTAFPPATGLLQSRKTAKLISVLKEVRNDSRESYHSQGLQLNKKGLLHSFSMSRCLQSEARGTAQIQHVASNNR